MYELFISSMTLWLPCGEFLATLGMDITNFVTLFLSHLEFKNEFCNTYISRLQILYDKYTKHRVLKTTVKKGTKKNKCL